jgi:peptide/nickel transport system substrate-binding protein
MESNYWSRGQIYRVSRRRTILAGVSGVIGASLLAACGGGKHTGKTDTTDKSGLLSVPIDTTKQAKRGGVGKVFLNVAPANWEVHQNPGQWFGRLYHPTLNYMVRMEEGYLGPASGNPAVDLPESYEFSPDRLQVTFKLPPNATFHPIPPVNGRLVDADDLMFSWNRLMNIGGQKTIYMNDVNPDNPVLSVSATDPRTVVMKLARPSATLLSALTNTGGASWFAIPKEADGGYDVRNKLIGSGPYYLAEEDVSTRVVLKRHPTYHVKDRPFMDSLEYPILTEYAAAMAQLRAGNIYIYDVKQEDILVTKKDVPDLTMQQKDPAGDGFSINYGYKPGPTAPFKDERLRQAMSMSFDRKLWIDTVYNVDVFERAGLASERVLNTCLVYDAQGWWLDPTSKDFGENSKYFGYDIAEAKKLLAAAGFPNGMDVSSNTASGGYIIGYNNEVAILEGMAAEAGFRFEKHVRELATEWLKQFRDSSGNHEGIGWRNMIGGGSDPVEKLAAELYSKSGVFFIGMDPEGKGTFAGDPHIDAELTKARAEFDTNKRKAIVHDLQRYMGARQYFTRFPGGSNSFTLSWPALQNCGVWQGGSPIYIHEWIDDTEKPLAKV